MVGPDYHRPAAVGITAAFKEAPPGWTVAQPQDAAPKGAWWTIYHDPLLDAAGAAGRASRTRTSSSSRRSTARRRPPSMSPARRCSRPSAAPPASPRGAAAAAGVARPAAALAGGTSGISRGPRTTLHRGGHRDWDLDVWGRIRRQVESDVAAAQVSAADLANATLSAQATLATDYFELRAQDALGKLLTDTVTAYAKALRITQNQYNAGTANPLDVAHGADPARHRAGAAGQCRRAARAVRARHRGADRRAAGRTDHRAGRARRPTCRWRPAWCPRCCCSAGPTSRPPNARCRRRTR